MSSGTDGACERCGSHRHYTHDCPTQIPIVTDPFDKEPGTLRTGELLRLILDLERARAEDPIYYRAANRLAWREKLDRLYAELDHRIPRREA